jgi:dephospho-CoA kinase
MCVTGQTQAAGKTTTLEALVSRSGLKAITGKTANLVQNYQERYAEIDSLTSAGFLSEKGGRWYPALIDMMKSRLTVHEPSEEDMTNIAGQIMLKLK